MKQITIKKFLDFCVSSSALCVVGAGVFLILFVGCKDKEISQKNFSYTSLDSSYEITIESPLAQKENTDKPLHPKSLKEKLILQKNGKTQNRVIMLVFIQQDCEDCIRYYEHLNHLDAESKALIIAVLASKIEEYQLIELQKKYAITFPLLNPKSNQQNELLTLLLENKFNKIQNDLNAINTFANEQTKDTTSNLDSQSIKAQKLPSLPYFVLFDKSQAFYQDYEGIIPEEIFSSDIASLSR